MLSVYYFQVGAMKLKLLFSLTGHGGGSWRVIIGVYRDAQRYVLFPFTLFLYSGAYMWWLQPRHESFASKFMGHFFQVQWRCQVHSPNITSKTFRLLDSVRQLARVTNVFCSLIRPGPRGPLKGELHHLTSILNPKLYSYFLDGSHLQ